MSDGPTQPGLCADSWWCPACELGWTPRQRAWAAQPSPSLACCPGGRPAQPSGPPSCPSALATPSPSLQSAAQCPSMHPGLCRREVCGSHTFRQTTNCSPLVGPWLRMESLPPAGSALTFLEREMRGKKGCPWSLPLAGCTAPGPAYGASPPGRATSAPTTGWSRPLSVMKGALGTALVTGPHRLPGL